MYHVLSILSRHWSQLAKEQRQKMRLICLELVFVWFLVMRKPTSLYSWIAVVCSLYDGTWHMFSLVLKKVIAHLHLNKPFTRCEKWCQMFCNSMPLYLAITYGGHMPSYYGWTIVEFERKWFQGLVLWFHQHPNSFLTFMFTQSVIHAVVGKLARGERVFESCFAIRLQHIQSEESHWLHRDLTVGQVKGKYEKIHPAIEWK